MKIRKCSVLHILKKMRIGGDFYTNPFETSLQDSLDTLTGDSTLPSTIKDIKYEVTPLDDDYDNVLMSALIIYEYDEEE